MTAIDRLATRLRDGFTLTPGEAERIARWFYDEYLPSQIIGMKGAADRIGLHHRDTGLPNSNSLTMRLARGATLDLLVTIAGTRVTTVDAIDAYAEMHPPVKPVGDDVTQQKEAS
jgi:hypothetical protein